MQTLYDVIVVGAGGSGLAAACSAAQLGGRVLVLEKEAQPGGTTGIAIGSFTAAGTSLQRQAGIQDDPHAHAEDAARFAAAAIEQQNNAELRAFFLREAAATFEWLRQLGLSFVGPSPEPPNRVPRMHNVVPGAKAYIATFQLTLQKYGGRLICGAPVERLIVDSGRVRGVHARIHGISREMPAARAVILAAGDYANNSQMIAEHLGAEFRKIEGINPHATGEGHLLARQAGARLLNMSIAYGPELRLVASGRKPFQQWLPATGPFTRLAGVVARRLPRRLTNALIKRLLVTWQHPENSLFHDGAVLVNRYGNRFVNETQWPDREIAVADQPDKLAYILLDGRLIGRYSAWPHFISTAPDIAYAYVQDYLRLRPDVTASAGSLDALARQRGFDPEALTQTRDEFNACVGTGQADRWGRRGDPLPLERPPWLVLGPVKAYFTTTEGGVLVNQQMQALDTQDRVIPGLYAAGQNGLGGMILWGHGLHIAWALTSGRLAGQHAMKSVHADSS